MQMRPRAGHKAEDRRVRQHEKNCARKLIFWLNRYVRYCMFLVEMLRYHNVEPLVVFDGSPLPAKRGTEVERREYYNVQYNLFF